MSSIFENAITESNLYDNDIYDLVQKKIGIDIDSVTQKLEDDGIGKFIKAFDKLNGDLNKKNLYRRKVRNTQKAVNLIIVDLNSDMNLFIRLCNPAIKYKFFTNEKNSY